MERVARNPVMPQVRQFSDPNICPTEQDVYSMGTFLRALMKTASRSDAACQRQRLVFLQQPFQEYADLYQQFYLDFRHTS